MWSHKSSHTSHSPLHPLGPPPGDWWETSAVVGGYGRNLPWTSSSGESVGDTDKMFVGSEFLGTGQERRWNTYSCGICSVSVELSGDRGRVRLHVAEAGTDWVTQVETLGNSWVHFLPRESLRSRFPHFVSQPQRAGGQTQWLHPVACKQIWPGWNQLPCSDITQNVIEMLQACKRMFHHHRGERDAACLKQFVSSLCGKNVC